MHPEIRLILTDLDGTFLGEKGALVSQNIEALKKANEAGYHIGIASGRLGCVCSKFALDIGLAHCHILALNGAHGLLNPYGADKWVKLMPMAQVEACLAVIDQLGAVAHAYTRDGAYMNKSFSNEVEKAAYEKPFKEAKCNIVIGPQALELGRQEGVIKFFVKPKEKNGSLAPLEEAFSKIEGVYLTASGKDNVEVMPVGAGKASGAQRLAEELGLTQNNVMFFGDFDNDIELLAWAKHSVAMGNGTEKAKKTARYHTLTNTQGGLAYMINRLITGAPLDGPIEGV